MQQNNGHIKERLIKDFIALKFSAKLKKKTIGIAILVILSFALVSQIALAANLTSVTVVYGQRVWIRSQSFGIYSCKAGLLRLVIDGKVYEGYCIDINHRLGTGSIKNITDAPDTTQFRRIAYITAWYDPKIAPNPNFEAASIQGAIWRVFFSPPYGVIWPSSVVTRMNVIYNEANGHNVARQGDTLTLTWEESSSFTMIATLNPPRKDVKIIFSTDEEGGSFSDTETITSTYAFTDTSGQATVEYFGDYPYKVTAYTMGGWPKIVDLTNSRYQDLIIIDPFKLEAETITPPQEVSTISGIKFHDRNGDGIKNDGEEVLSGWTITLHKWDGNQWVQVGNTTTDKNGYYEFSVSEAGTYKVYETLQQGWDQTAPDNGYYEITINEEYLGNSFDGKNFGNKQTTTLSASKTATGHWIKNYTWNIDKSVTPSTLNLFVNDQGTIHYTITVTKTELTERYYVSGNITVNNTGSVDTEGLWIRDVVQAYVDGNWVNITTMEIVAKGNDTISIGQTKYYNYEIEFTPYENATEYRNIAIITITNYSGHLGYDYGPEAIESFSLPGKPTGLANNEVQVSDDETIPCGLDLVSSNEPKWPQTINSTTTFEFDKNVKSSTAGTYVINDTATVTGDKGLLNSDNEKVTVNVYALQVTKTFVLTLTKNNPQTGYTYYGAVRLADTQDGWQSVELTGTATYRSGTIPNLTPGLYDWKIYTIDKTTNTEIVIDSGIENITGEVTNEYRFGVTSLTVTKTVDGVTRTYNMVTRTYNITGTITIKNKNTGSYDAIIMSINDIIEYKEQGNNIWVQIKPSEFVYEPVITTVDAGQTVTLQYYAIFDASGIPANASWRNTVEVTIFNHPDGIHVFHHTVSFKLPT